MGLPEKQQLAIGQSNFAADGTMINADKRKSTANNHESEKKQSRCDRSLLWKANMALEERVAIGFPRPLSALQSAAGALVSRV